MRKSTAIVASILTAAAFVVAGSGVASADGPDTWADVTGMLSRTAGETFDVNGNPASEYAWTPVDSTHSNIRWGVPSTWDTETNQYYERFVIDKPANKVVQLGWHQNGTDYNWHVLSEMQGPDCTHQQPLQIDTRGEIYAPWISSSIPLCKTTTGYMLEVSSGKQIHVRHEQELKFNVPCVSRYKGNATCWQQTERWYDDRTTGLSGNLVLQTNRTVLNAKGGRMAYQSKNASGQLTADGYAYWSW